jgi:hypothetical protein
VASTRASGRADASTCAMAPEPVHRSTAVPRSGTRPAAVRARVSDCHRGTYTPGWTVTSSPQNRALPVIHASGSPATRRAIIELSEARSGAQAISSAASSSAATHPAAIRARMVVAESTASRVGTVSRRASCGR